MKKSKKKCADKHRDKKVKTVKSASSPSSEARRKASPKKSGTAVNGLFKFRRYKKEEGGAKKKARHPKLIVTQEKQDVGFMGLTKSKKRGHHKNIELDVNPKKGEIKKAYLRKEIRHDDIGNFGEILKDYKLSESDKKKVIAYIESLNKKK